MSSSNNHTQSNSDLYSKVDEIDLNLFTAFLVRNKKLIIVISILGVFFTGFSSFISKRSWKGMFQIHISDELASSTSSNLSIPRGAKFSNSLDTEVEILKSPSVLLDVFNFATLNKNKSGNNIRFKSWRNFLDIKLQPGTSILNIAYNDTNKDIILPVLNKISNTYQQYSENNRRRSLNFVLDYYKNQITNYKQKSDENNKKLREYAFNNDLTFLDQPKSMDSEIDLSSIEFNSIPVERQRVISVNKIRVLDEQLNLLKSYKNNPNAVLNLSIFNVLDPVKEEIDDLKKKIFTLKKSFKDTDIKLVRLNERKKLLTKFYYQEMINNLEKKKSLENANVIAFQRPTSVLVKYQSLLNVARKDINTLNSLESDLRLTELEIARNLEPWKLITKPTLLPYPNSRGTLSKMLAGGVMGTLIGCLISFLIEKRKGYINSTIPLKSIPHQYRLIETLEYKNKNEWSKSVKLLSKGVLSGHYNDIAIIVVGDINQSDINIIKDYLNEFLSVDDIISTNDLILALEKSNLILLIQLGVTKNLDFNDIIDELYKQNNNILGTITLA